MNLKHNNNLTFAEFIRYYERECTTPLEKVLMNRLMNTYNTPVADKETQAKLDEALSTLEDIVDLARSF